MTANILTMVTFNRDWQSHDFRDLLFSKEHSKVINCGYGKILVFGNSFNCKIKKETTFYYYSVASNIAQT